MAPWMVIVALIGVGFVVLLVAPTIHRRINVRSREEAERVRLDRASGLRDSHGGATRQFDSARKAVGVRDALLLRGVRAEIVDLEGLTELVFHVEDEAVVDEVISEREAR